ncbi:MAG: hypothetical protein RL701_1616 [Pseudomonadota bacterium]|jgi:predicted ATPase
MSDDRRALYADALTALLKGEIAKVAVTRNFRLLEEIARLARSDAPLELATTDPALYASWRSAVTRFHISGWTEMTPERVASIAAVAISPTAPSDSSQNDSEPG